MKPKKIKHLAAGVIGYRNLKFKRGTDSSGVEESGGEGALNINLV